MPARNQRLRRLRTPLGVGLLLLSGVGGVVAMGVERRAGAQPVDYPDHANLRHWIANDGTSFPIRAPADWERRRAHVANNVQLVMGPLPDRTELPALQLETLSDEIVGKVRRRKLSYVADLPNQRVSAWFLTPAATSGSRLPAVLCLHQTNAIGKDEPAGLGGGANLHYALELAERGYAALAPDYPSFGEYEYAFNDPRYLSGSMKAINDNRRAVDVLESLPEVDAARLGVIGHSLGGHNAIFTAFFEPRIKGIVSSCGFTRFHKYYGGKLAGWTSARYMPLIASTYHNNPDEVPFDFPELIAALAPRPFLAAAPVGDDNFDVGGVRETMAAAGDVYKLYGVEDRLQAIYPECAHDFPPAVRDVAYRFFDAHLGHDVGRRDE